jgi:uncharacterized protein YecE (DUF72 family)
MSGSPHFHLSFASKLRVGCSGWSYQDWVGPFYPRNTEAKDYLRLYSSVFNTVEIDSSFYRMPNQFMINLWKRSTPESFLFSAKVPKKITHDAKLRDTTQLMSYLYSTMKGLGTRMGPLIIQLPPSFKYEKDFVALQTFVSELDAKFKHAIEFRHKSWFRQDIYSLLEKNNVAFCWAVSQYVETPRVLTADFIYARMVGDRSITKFDGIQKDKSGQIIKMKDDLQKAIDDVDDAFLFFNNHFAGFSPESVNEFRRLSGLMEMDWTKLAGLGSTPGAAQTSLSDF